MRPFREAARYYAEYRYRPSDEFLRLLATHLNWTSRTRVLDLGAGPAHISMHLAPLVGEVVVMDPEEEMIAEGRRRAAGVANLAFVVGGSDDLAMLKLGPFDAVLISQALHWMHDKHGVLRALEAPTVAIVGYVKEPDYNTIWLDREPWNVLEDLLRPYLARGLVDSALIGRRPDTDR